MEFFREGNIENYEESEEENEMFAQIFEECAKRFENSVFLLNIPKLKGVIPIVKKIKDDLDTGGLSSYKLKTEFSSPPTVFSISVRTDYLEILTECMQEKEEWSLVDRVEIYTTTEKDFPIGIEIIFYDMATEIGKSE